MSPYSKRFDPNSLLLFSWKLLILIRLICEINDYERYIGLLIFFKYFMKTIFYCFCSFMEIHVLSKLSVLFINTQKYRPTNLNDLMLAIMKFSVTIQIQAIEPNIEYKYYFVKHIVINEGILLIYECICIEKPFL